MHVPTGSYSAENVLHSSQYNVLYRILVVQALLSLMEVME